MITKIGRKLYFDKVSGNLLLDTGEMAGSVRKTTFEEDLQVYQVLNERMPETVGLIQLEYGQFADEFRICTGYYVNLDTGQVIFSFAPTETTLEQAKQAHIGYLQSKYNQSLTEGFVSTATATEYIFGYGQSDREKFMQLAILVLSGMASFPVPIPSKDSEIVLHDQAQYQQLLVDISTFGWTQQTKLQTLIAQVKMATTVEEINNVVW